jgi:hypothetical protein
LLIHGGAPGLEMEGTDLKLRRLWLPAAVLMAALILAAPAAAAPKHYKVLGKARHHLGKPKRHNLIAVRHGRHIHWYSKTHGLPKKKLPPIKLSGNFRPGYGVRDAVFGPTSVPSMVSTGPCNFGAPHVTDDGMSYVQSYGDLAADVLSCVGHNSETTMDNSYFPSPACGNSGAKSVDVAPLEIARFTDGEWMALCTVPDDNGAGGSAANDHSNSTAAYAVYQQGFTCEVVVGVGSDGSTPFVTRTKDSLEYSQTYTENGQDVTAVTTSCIGQLPSGQTAPGTASAHLVSCTQYDPKAPGKVVKGLGETITYPDGQFQETCNVPNYTNSVDCTAGTTCSSDVRADDTSDLTVFDSATTGGTLTETVDYGTPLNCVPEQFGSYRGFDPNWYGFSYSGSGSKVLVYDLFTLEYNEGNDVQFCFGATEPFQTLRGGGAGTLPDGSPGFIGLLLNCDDTDGPQPCIESVGPIYRDTSGPTGTQVRVDIPESFAADPFGHG